MRIVALIGCSLIAPIIIAQMHASDHVVHSGAVRALEERPFQLGSVRQGRSQGSLSQLALACGGSFVLC